MLVLASQSPRRKQILAAAGLPFIVRAPRVPEERQNAESAEDYVCRLARDKAVAVSAGPGEFVLGADTTVVLDEHVLEKPRDAAAARHMLEMLSGREHEVITGICLRGPNGQVVDRAITRVRFLALTTREISDYIASGEPMDKAGAYGIQGRASKFIERVEGCYFNVMGLPVSLVYRHLKALGYVA